MRILILTPTHNGLSQRAYVELVERGHTVSVQPAISDVAIEAAAAYFQPQLIIATFLKKSLPPKILKTYNILTVKPLSSTDRGSSSLNGTISESWQDWRITLQQATKENNFTEIQCTHSLKIRPQGKNNFFRHHVAQAAVQDIVESVEKFEKKAYTTRPTLAANLQMRGRLHNISY